jgi:hypothetical protein
MSKGYLVLFSEKKNQKPSQVWYQYKKDATKFSKSLKKDGWIAIIVKGK